MLRLSSDERARLPFDCDQARRFHRILATVRRRSRSSARRSSAGRGVQFWWGAFDLAVLLFSGAQVTPPEDRGYIMRYDLDAEHLNAGFWPGDDSAPRATSTPTSIPGPTAARRLPSNPRRPAGSTPWASGSCPTTRCGQAPTRSGSCSTSCAAPTGRR